MQFQFRLFEFYVRIEAGRTECDHSEYKLRNFGENGEKDLCKVSTYLNSQFIIHIFILFQKVSFTIDIEDKDGSYKTGQRLLRADYCEIVGSGKIVRNPLLNTIVTMVRKFGKLPLACPIKKVTILNLQNLWIFLNVFL
jgi:hypothetical protein